jgi:hypothetical protein
VFVKENPCGVSFTKSVAAKGVAAKGVAAKSEAWRVVEVLILAKTGTTALIYLVFCREIDTRGP